MTRKGYYSLISNAHLLNSCECSPAYLSIRMNHEDLGGYRFGDVILICCQAIWLTEVQIVNPSLGYGHFGDEDHSNVYSI